MISEIAIWVVLLTGVSQVLPYTIPSIRSKLQSMIVSQEEYDMIDKTIGQLISSACQILIIMGAVVDLITPIPYLTPFVIGYFVYDMIHLYTKPYGKTQTIFFLHHGLTIVMVGYVYLIESPYKLFNDICYIVLETSSLSLNITNCIKYFYPNHPNMKLINFINISIYGLFRMLLYPINIGHGIYMLYNSNDAYIIQMHIFPVSLLLILYAVCVNWFIVMVTKHYQIIGDK
jgi:hypothetical protein